MLKFVRFCLPAFILLGSQFAVADNWTQATADELRMTAEPGAPGAAVTCLGMSVIDDYDRTLTRTIYVRLKILTERGQEYADVEIPYEGDNTVKSIEARTVHSDGSVTVFSGMPYDKLIEKGRYTKSMAKVITLPDVQVGSIIEYRIVYQLGSLMGWYPEWFVQKQFFIRKAHYEYTPNRIEYLIPRPFSVLPKGTEVHLDTKHKSYSLDAENIPPLVDEEYEPPMRSLSYRVLFYYTDSKSAEEYWKTAGAAWSKSVDQFMYASDLRSASAGIVHASDSQTEKARSLYDAVMKLENTDFTRERNHAEDKAQRVNIENAVDVWKARRGNSNEIALLYVALARAAGLQAYGAKVVDRSEAVFLPEFPSKNQLDAFVAIVNVDGKEMFLDPGERYCPFGELSWKHAGAGGLRQTAQGSELTLTPALGYKASTIMRSADLSVEASGVVTGSIRVAVTGNPALIWRQDALRTDELETGKQFEERLKKGLPEGAEIHVAKIAGLADYNSPLTFTLDVKGVLGNAAGKRLILPATLFTADNQTLFAEKTRLNPVDFEFPYLVQDTVKIRLPDSMAIESVPQSAELTIPKNALYRSAFKNDNGQITSSRLLLLANNLYSVDEYAALRDFFQKISLKDKEQAILKASSNSASPGAN